ncbi:MAG: class II aldolase/adducin family protein [Kiritimatiellae bacterium]|nr:class II aldolase/adducin family protein [Kiritimatiellia bacterium]
MDFQSLHPRDQLAVIMERIYRCGMTTASGGNLSVLDEAGEIWITPAGVDKGDLFAEDIVCVKAGGSTEGRHRPSSELPLHKAVYAARPDVRAVIHAHPCALVAFCLVRGVPDTRILPQAAAVCGSVGYTPYTFPASEQLGQAVAAGFRDGHNTVLLENHGAVTAGQALLQAFHRLETLEFCAQLTIRAHVLGRATVLSDEQIAMSRHTEYLLEEYEPRAQVPGERALRLELCEFVRRAYRQRIMISTEGTLSARLDDGSFLITPYGFDRAYVETGQLVRIDRGRREAGKVPSRAVRLHEAIYASRPEVGCILCAQAPHSTAFSVVADATFDTAAMPESYVMLRELPVVPFGPQYEDVSRVAALITKRTPVLLIRNDGVLATGRSPAEAYDRVEVAEFSARSLIEAAMIGEVAPISRRELARLDQAYPVE